VSVLSQLIIASKGKRKSNFFIGLFFLVQPNIKKSPHRSEGSYILKSIYP
jgi:hypothetical protein